MKISPEKNIYSALELYYNQEELEEIEEAIEEETKQKIEETKENIEETKENIKEETKSFVEKLFTRLLKKVSENEHNLKRFFKHVIIESIKTLLHQLV